jgi:hypothetical protein
MIDTIRTKTILDSEKREKIASKSKEKVEIQHPKNTQEMEDMDLDGPCADLEIGDSDEWDNRYLYNEISVFFKNCHIKTQIIRGNLFLEFSAPKVIYGSNIYMLYPNKIEEVLETVRDIVENHYEVRLPGIEEWILQRLDICYAWRLPTEEDTKHLLATLASYEFPRKKKTIISDESLTYWGTTCKVKFYRKQPEYKAHSFGRPKKYTYAYSNAKNMLEACKGILRFEVTMYKKQLQQIFKDKDVNYSVINYAKIESLLVRFLSQLVKTDNFKLIDIREVYSKLETAYDKKKAVNLLQFLNMWFCENKEKERHSRLLLDNLLSTSTINNRLNAITEAGIGIIDTGGKCIDFDLSIPSKLATNSPTDDVMELLPKVRKPEKGLGGVKTGRGSAS